MYVNNFCGTPYYPGNVYGCDLPQNGGISGNLGRNNKPIPGACEERPAKYDPKTGEMVYVDQWLLQQAKDNGAVFSTTA